MFAWLTKYHGRLWWLWTTFRWERKRPMKQMASVAVMKCYCSVETGIHVCKGLGFSAKKSQICLFSQFLRFGQLARFHFQSQGPMLQAARLNFFPPHIDEGWQAGTGICYCNIPTMKTKTLNVNHEVAAFIGENNWLTKKDYFWWEQIHTKH